MIIISPTYEFFSLLFFKDRLNLRLRTCLSKRDFSLKWEILVSRRCTIASTAAKSQKTLHSLTRKRCRIFQRSMLWNLNLVHNCWNSRNFVEIEQTLEQKRRTNCLLFKPSHNDDITKSWLLTRQNRLSSSTTTSIDVALLLSKDVRDSMNLSVITFSSEVIISSISETCTLREMKLSSSTNRWKFRCDISLIFSQTSWKHFRSRQSARR